MSFDAFRQLRRNSSKRRRPNSVTLSVQNLESRVTPAVNVLTFHNNLQSQGLNAAETALSPSNVQVATFGKLFTTPVDGDVYAQPLIDTGVTIAAGPNTVGTVGVHDVVFVATEHDSLYAIDSSAAFRTASAAW